MIFWKDGELCAILCSGCDELGSFGEILLGLEGLRGLVRAVFEVAYQKEGVRPRDEVVSMPPYNLEPL